MTAIKSVYLVAYLLQINSTIEDEPTFVRGENFLSNMTYSSYKFY